MKRLGEAICLLFIQMEARGVFLFYFTFLLIPWSSTFVYKGQAISVSPKDHYFLLLFDALDKSSAIILANFLQAKELPTWTQAFNQNWLVCTFSTIFPTTWATLMWICMALIWCAFTKDTHPEPKRLWMLLAATSSPMHRYLHHKFGTACMSNFCNLTDSSKAYSLARHVESLWQVLIALQRACTAALLPRKPIEVKGQLCPSA